MDEGRRTRKSKKFWIDLIATGALFLLDVAVFIFGMITDKFVILQYSDGVYSVNNSALMVILTLVVVGILTIYHGCLLTSTWNIVKTVDENGIVNDGVNKIQAHLVNNYKNTIEYSELSDKEAEAGVNDKGVKSEIWVITNNFEETNDSDAGKKFRKAIIQNILCNSSYFYIIPKTGLGSVELLCSKLKKEMGNRKPSNVFFYIVDDTLDFIPAPYFDILLYIKRTPGGRLYGESSSEIYYCFSRINEEDKYFYQSVDTVEEKMKLINYVKNYREKHRFTTGI